MAARDLPAVEIRPEFLAFTGGADYVSPPLRIPPGFAREAQNWEQDINGGYSRVVGYERFSGKAKPSDAAYAVLDITLTGALAVADVLTDNAGTSFGTVIAIEAGNARVALTLMTGHFTAGNIKVGAVTVGTCAAAEVTDGAATPLLHAQYRNLAADVYRALIAAVPGSGTLLGVWLYNDVVYAFRNNAGATAVDMYKSTASGWSLVALGREVAFTSGGTYTVVEGDTITGATSAATAVITRVVLTSGTWAAGTAAGRLIFASQTGTFQAENLNVGANLNVATIAGNSSAITFAVPNGRFEFMNKNFGGSANTTRMYGCDGKNRGFEFDGTVFVPIATGMTADTPTHLCAHKNHLFFSFVGSIQHCAPGQPYVWSVIVGAAELAMGDTVTGFMPQPSGTTEAALAIFTRNNISILYGSGVASWLLNPFEEEAGGYAYSIQRVGTTYMFDDRGLTSLRTTQTYGNFASATLSKRIHSWLKTKRTLVSASCIIRDKNQYRLFFSDGSALYVTFDNGKIVGMLPILLVDPVRCVVSGEMLDGTEVCFMGSADGFVYQMEKGTSFDGDAIEAFLHLVFNHSGTPRQMKHYRTCTFEIAGDGYFAFSFTYELGYAATTIEQPGSVTIVNNLSPALWDSFVWDSFFWDGLNLLPAEAKLEGDGENISLRIRSNSDYYEAARISGALITYTPRVLKR